MASDAREYRRLSTLLDRDDPDLSDDDRLVLARRLVELAPAAIDSWWTLANQLDWMLRSLDEQTLRDHPLLPELIAAYDRAIAMDCTDAASPYNKARILARAGVLDAAYAAFMLAGRTEASHPTEDVEWPADWHFESAAEVAMRSGDQEAALQAARAAIEAGATDADAPALLNRLRNEH